jgi:hypothetical protein
MLDFAARTGRQLRPLENHVPLGHGMFPLVARRLLAALLAVAMIASPVVVNGATCCRRALAEGIAGEHSCCCAKRSADAQPMSCCSAADDEDSEKPCCAAKRRAAMSIGAAPSPCCCKARQGVPAVVEGRIRFDQRDAHFLCAWIVTTPSVAREDSPARVIVELSESLPGTALHKLHCRWTV